MTTCFGYLVQFKNGIRRPPTQLNRCIVPSNYNKNAALPVIVNFHGWGVAAGRLEDFTVAVVWARVVVALGFSQSTTRAGCVTLATRPSSNHD